MEHQPLGVFINKDGAGTFTGFRVPTVNKWTYLLCMLAAGTLASAAGDTNRQLWRCGRLHDWPVWFVASCVCVYVVCKGRRGSVCDVIADVGEKSNYNQQLTVG